MSKSLHLTALESDLHHYNPQVRTEALAKLAGLAQSGAIADVPELDVANMHCHTFIVSLAGEAARHQIDGHRRLRRPGRGG
jgi:hypothetical protein